VKDVFSIEHIERARKILNNPKEFSHPRYVWFPGIGLVHPDGSVEGGGHLRDYREELQKLFPEEDFSCHQ
jgi:hypothetical protein